MDSFIALLFTAGGVGTIAAIFNGIKSHADIKQESEKALMNRLQDVIRDGSEREAVLTEARLKEEERAEMFKMARDEAEERATRYRRQLLEHGIIPDG